MTKRKRGKDISIAEEKDPFFFSGVAALKERERQREGRKREKKKISHAYRPMTSSYEINQHTSVGATSENS